MVKKILIAEDEKPMARALEAKLKGEGYNAKAVFNGKEAIQEIEVGKYDLALLDLIMPEMDGFGVLGWAKKNQIKTPIIVATNLSQEQDEKKAKELGAIDYFVKSDTPLSVIVKKVKSVLGS